MKKIKLLLVLTILIIKIHFTQDYFVIGNDTTFCISAYISTNNEVYQMHYWDLNNQKKNIPDIIKEGIESYRIDNIIFHKVKVQLKKEVVETYVNYVSEDYTNLGINMFFHKQATFPVADEFLYAQNNHQYNYYKNNDDASYKLINTEENKEELVSKYKSCDYFNKRYFEKKRFKKIKEWNFNPKHEFEYSFYCLKNKKDSKNYFVTIDGDTTFCAFLEAEYVTTASTRIRYVDRLGKQHFLETDEVKQNIESYCENNHIYNRVPYVSGAIDSKNTGFRWLKSKGEISYMFSYEYPRYKKNGILRDKLSGTVGVVKIENEFHYVNINNLKKNIMPHLLKNEKFKKEYKGKFSTENYNFGFINGNQESIGEFDYMIKFYNNYCN